MCIINVGSYRHPGEVWLPSSREWSRKASIKLVFIKYLPHDARWASCQAVRGIQRHWSYSQKTLNQEGKEVGVGGKNAHW